jgi:indolepyruvate ferredoxin oxidoreductase
MERRLITEYEAVVEDLIDGLTVDNHALAVEIASLPEQIRGYGHVKERNVNTTKAQEQNLMALFRSPTPHARAAE